MFPQFSLLFFRILLCDVRAEVAAGGLTAEMGSGGPSGSVWQKIGRMDLLSTCTVQIKVGKISHCLVHVEMFVHIPASHLPLFKNKTNVFSQSHLNFSAARES